MTTIYFIRHAEPAREMPNTDATFPLTEKGKADTALVTHFLRGKGIEAVLSSPFKRAADTVAPFARELGVEVELIEDFRERAVGHEWVEDFRAYGEAQWADFSYKLEGGECLAEVQKRNIAALRGVLRRFKGKNIAVGTHGTALSLIINYFDPAYDRRDFWEMVSKMPWCVKITFEDGNDADTPRCTGIEKIDLFDISQVVTICHRLDTFSQYRYTVIFAYIITADGERKWLYPRHKERSTWECAGGRIEDGETPLEGAARELREETGAKQFEIRPLFDYTVHRPGGSHEQSIGRNPGQVFLAYISEMGEIPPDSEMAEVRAFDGMPEGELTYPEILPVLFNMVYLSQ